MAGAGGWHLIISKYFHSHRNCRWPFNLRVDTWATTFQCFPFACINLADALWQKLHSRSLAVCPVSWILPLHIWASQAKVVQSVSQSVCHLDCSSCDQPLAFTLTTVTPILLCLWTGPPLSWKIWDLVFWNFKSVEWIKSNLLKSQFKCLMPVRY